MSLYLNMNQNVRGKPNENYAREFMELFCLGPTGPDGTPNYTQDDVVGPGQGVHGLGAEHDPTLADESRRTRLREDHVRARAASS